MTRSSMNRAIRKATVEDIPKIVDITKANNHYWTPEVDGPEALARLLQREDNVLLVAENEGEVIGFIIGSWDGARAMLTKLSVLPEAKGLGTGTMLVNEAIEELKGKGAPTVGVFAADGTRPHDEENDSTGFWERIDFEYIPARLMINFNIWGENESDHGQMKKEQRGE